MPDPDALAHSARVVAAVRGRIADSGGWIPFAQYMQDVLYAPGLGYYVAGARKFGAAGDFVTAPEMTPLFAAALAAPIEAVLRESGSDRVLELGAGSGALAAGLLRALASRGIDARYSILEVSPDLRERQRATAPGVAAWLDRVPDRIDGVVVMNEVLDAIAPHVVSRRGGEWLERGVSVVEGALAWSDRPLGPGALRALAEERFPAEGDYTSEINPDAEALVETVARRMRSGAMLVLDYGFVQREYYHPQRSAGTLMGHYRHRSHDDPFLWPGLSDLTAHVDFTAIAQAGDRAGLTVAGYTSLAAFLVGSGILDRLAEAGDPSSPAYMREAASVQRLLSPAEMGELFKALALTVNNGGIVSAYFAAADRTHRL